MIEMLGVLAIIAVLSVGGIAGYSKAMTQFKVNKIIAETNQLIADAHEYTLKDKSFSISPYVSIRKSLGLCPDSWENCADSGLGGNVLMADNSIAFSPKVPEMCLAAVNNIAIPLKESVEYAYISSQGPTNSTLEINVECMSKFGKAASDCTTSSPYYYNKPDALKECYKKAEKIRAKCLEDSDGKYKIQIKNNYIGDDGNKYDESTNKGTLDFNDPRLISAVAAACCGENSYVQITFKKGVIGN